MEAKLTEIQKRLESREGDIEDLFSECFMVHSYKKSGKRPVGTVACGSSGFQDTPKALYRLLYLTRQSGLDFSDMVQIWRAG